MQGLEELRLFVDIARPLLKPGHTVTSHGQLARWVRIEDAKLRRIIDRMSDSFGGVPLVKLVGRRLTLTATGREAVVAAEKLLAVGRRPDADPAVEVATVEVAPAIDPTALMTPLAPFLEEWAGLVTLRLQPLDPDGLRGNLSSGSTAFGLGFAEADGSSGAVLLDRPVPWTVIARQGDRWGEAGAGSSVAALLSAGRLFAAVELLDRLPDLLRDAGPNLVLVPTLGAVRAAVIAGLGAGLDLDFGAEAPPGFTRLPVDGLPPCRLGLYLPRRPEQMTEAGKALLAAIRSAFTPVAQLSAEATESDETLAERLSA